jgi:hypothetical protein
MIVHTICNPKPVRRSVTPASYLPPMVPQVPTIFPRTKEWYNDYLNKLYVVLGDIVVPKNVIYPYPNDEYWRVCGIQEARFLVDWDKGTGTPKAIHIKNRKGESKWVTQESVFRIQNPPVEIPA